MSIEVFEPLLTVRQVAAWLSISENCVYLWCHQRRLPHVVLSVGNRKETFRFKSSEIRLWIEQRERNGKPINKFDLR